MHDATGAPVWCPELETELLANINAYAFPGFGPFENYDADHTVAGGEVLELAGLTFDVRFTPGHSPGHVTYAVRDESTLLSGDVLFQGSIGRTDLPGGDIADPARLDRVAARRVPARDEGLPGSRRRHHARQRAGKQPVPPRARAPLVSRPAGRWRGDDPGAEGNL